MAMDAPLLQRTLGGRFKITGHIGEGAMASVFRGVDLQKPDSGEIAVKIMHPHLASDRTFTARFKREAQAASMVKHPNTVTIIDLGEEQGVHYIVMELCPGRDLRATLQAEQRLPAPRAVKIIMTICDALHAAHKLGVVHRDLKPENVMILHDPKTDTDLVKVLDFGIAKLVDAQPKVRVGGTDSDPPPALTQFGVVVGTPQYMSPEQCRGQPLDGRSDVYTCGVLLYQLTTGQLPFNSDSPFEVAGKQAFEPPPPPSTHLPSLDPDLEAIILRTLAKAPAERPQSAGELRDALKHWLDTHAAVDKMRSLASDGGAEARRAFGKTLPIKPAAGAPAAPPAPPVAPTPPPRPGSGPIERGPAAGPFQPTAASAAAVSTFASPPTYDAQGPLGTIVAMEAISGPPPNRGPLPAAGSTARDVSPSSPALFDPQAARDRSPPEVSAIQPALHAFAPPGVGAADASLPGVQPPAQPAPQARPNQASGAVVPPSSEGWGAIGYVMILLSLLAGVALGFGLYKLAPF